MCREVIGNMYGYNAMEVQEAFNKIREQARAFLAQPEQLVGGLNLVNQQDLVYFQPLHQAELFRLKGIFLQVSAQHLKQFRVTKACLPPITQADPS